MKRFFSKDIFKQTIKKLGLISILTLLLSVMITVLILATKYSVTINGFPFDYASYSINGSGINPYMSSAIAPILLAVMFIGSVIFTYTAFRYQNKRELSDKYHSLPYTKTQQFTSRILAVLAMLYAIIIITMLSAWITMNAVGSDYIPMHIPMLILGYMSSATLIAAITATAMSFTGNLFANLSVTAVLLFLPRSILFVIGILIKFISFDFIQISTVNVFLDPSANIPVGVLLDASTLWEYHGMSETLIAPKGIIYTFVLALVYLGIALFLSNKRKSELAGKSFASPRLGYIFASLCSAPLFVYAGYIIVKNFFSFIDASLYTTIIKPMITPAIFAFLLFVIISLIYRTKFKGMAKGFALFLTISIIALCLTALGAVCARGMINKHIDKDKVEYVTIDLSPEKDMINTPTYAYGWLMSKEVKIYDHKIIETMIYNMDEAIDVINRSPYHASQDLSHVNFWCTFHMNNGNEITRYIPIVVDYESKKIGNLLINNTEYYTALSSLPEINEIDNYYALNLPSDEKALAYTVLESVLTESKDSEITRVQLFPYYLDKYFTPISYPYSTGAVYFDGRHENIKYVNYIYIDDTIPESQKMYLNAVSKFRKAEFDEALDIVLNTPMEDLQFELLVSIAKLYEDPYWLHQNELDFLFSTYEYTNKLTEEQVYKMCQAFIDTDPDDFFLESTNYARVNIHLVREKISPEKRIYTETYVPISNELYEEFEEWFKEITQ